MTAGESGRAGDEDDRVSHALWLAAEQAEEAGKRSKARQHERKVRPSIARDRRADGWQEVDDLEVSPDAAALRHVSRRHLAIDGRVDVPVQSVAPSSASAATRGGRGQVAACFRVWRKADG